VGGVSRRSTAIVTAFVLLLGCALVAVFATVPYARFKPGLTIDLLSSESNGRPIVEVDGHETYKTDGQLRMTTVSSSLAGQHISLWEAMLAWADPDKDLYPYDAIYAPDTSVEEERTESQLEMVSSQDHAIAAALTELGFKLETRPTVLRTIPGSAADGKLQPHDVIVAIDGKTVTKAEDVVEVVQALEPGAKVTMDILRDGKPMTVELVTKPSPDDPTKAAIGIYPGTGYDFPFDVKVNIPEQIGGPSAGLVFALAIYDTLTPGSLTDGAKIAGTGTIDEAGRVGPIGGIRQKIAGAEADGAKVFLVPPANCDEAMRADTELKLVRADTMHSAVEALEAYAEDPDAELPACPAVVES
jgi:Lon-like protease